MDKQLRDLFWEAINADIEPPKELKEIAVMQPQLFDQDIMEALVNKGWVKRQKCEVWTRVMGYFRPSSQFNKGKKQEFKERKKLSPKGLGV